jgi:hypothetical protein
MSLRVELERDRRHAWRRRIDGHGLGSGGAGMRAGLLSTRKIN